MKINNKVFEEFKSNVYGVFTLLFLIAGLVDLLIVISNILIPVEHIITTILVPNVIFFVIIGGLHLLIITMVSDYLIVKDLEECESVFDIESVNFNGFIELIANSPVSLTHEFTNALNDLYVSVRFKDLGCASFRISYSDYLALDGKALVKYQKIKTLSNRDVIDILDVDPVA